MGPELEVADKSLAKWPAAIFREAPKWPKKWPDRQISRTYKRGCLNVGA